MLYKEWKPFLLKILIFAVVSLVLVMGKIGIDGRLDELFLSWMKDAIFYVTVFTVGIGAINITEERTSNTLNFLLTHPISRTRIYITKLGLNLAAFLIPFLLSSALVFWVDQSKADPTTLEKSLVMSSLVILLGIMLACMGTLLSFFTKSTNEAIVIGLAFIGSYLIAYLVFTFSTYLNTVLQIRIDLASLLLLGGLLIILTIGFLKVGLHFFKTKEF